ncbi:MAG TPA: cobalamin biosynthesis bifunctional protein CbiET, partial [Candidatus Spyradocola merdavium]|nr:cobalamin biosynthesis bifunctional protein CbiET [Candidatus Spyradocola merdavium]
MKYTLIGMGGGTDATLTAQGRLALLRADAIAGAARLLETLPEGCTPRRCAATKP